MAVDIFLKLDGVKGEAKDSTHADELDVISWSWGGSQSGASHMGGGSGAGKVNIQNLSITKYVDKSSPTLFLKMCGGTPIKKATLVVRKAGDKPLEYIKLTMEDLIVSDMSTGGSGGKGSDDRITEHLSLNFTKFNFEYVPQKADGSGDASVECKWDIKKNASF